MTDRIKPPPVSGSEAIAQLRELDRATRRRGVSAATGDRVRRSLRKRAVEQPFFARLRWWPVVGFAAGAAVMAIVVGGVLGPRSGAEHDVPRSESLAVAQAKREVQPQRALVAESRQEPKRAADSLQGPAACSAWHEGPATLDADQCQQGEGLKVSALMPSNFEFGTDSIITLRSGALVFDVQPRAENPLHVVAGGMDIEVVGTRFVVQLQEGKGAVSVLEGHVRVHTNDDVVHDLHAAERLSWPKTATAAVAPVPSRRPPKSRPVAPNHDADFAQLAEEVAQLRGRGEYRAALTLLRSGLTRGWGLRSRELLSYEIGTILERHLSDVPGACTHWTRHITSFPKGRYVAMVTRIMARLGCD